MSDFGAYGLRLTGLLPPPDYLFPASEEWPTCHLTWEPGQGAPSDGYVGPDDAVLALQPDGRTIIDRASGTAVFRMPRPPSPEVLAHPGLTTAAVVISTWAGRNTFHAGAFLHGDRAWAVLGSKEAGKTSLLAGLAARDVPVLADDLFVLDGDTAWSGPRILDLRQSASRRLGRGRALGVVGLRERWRVDLGPVAASHPFGGWVSLGWGERVSVTTTPLRDRILQLQLHTGVAAWPPPPERLLELASRPTWHLVRPRDWDQLDAGLDALLQRLG